MRNHFLSIFSALSLVLFRNKHNLKDKNKRSLKKVAQTKLKTRINKLGFMFMYPGACLRTVLKESFLNIYIYIYMINVLRNN